MLPFDVLRMVKSESGGGSGGGSGVLASASATARTITRGTGQAYAAISLNSDGTCTAFKVGGPAYWYDPVTASIGNSYWALVTVSMGALTSGTVGSRVQIGTGKTWACETSGTAALREEYAIGTLEIWTASTGGTKVAEWDFEIEAVVDNT